jgi:protein O-mannosyl-transferase
MWFAFAIIIAVVVAYIPALPGPFVMDDVLGVTGNPSIERFMPPGSAFTPPPNTPVSGRPVVNVSLAVNHRLNDLLGIDQRPDPDGPFKTVGYRLVNLLFHLCTGALLFGVLRRAIRERAIPEDWRSVAEPVAGIVCALWLLHPIQTEVINYVVQRTEGLASLFYVATLYCSIRAWDSPDEKIRLRWYAGAVLACVLGVGSKEVAISAPLAVILYDRAFRLPSWAALVDPTENANGRRPFYIALAVACIGSFAIFSYGARGDSAGFASGVPVLGYFYSQCWAIAHYLRLVVWPNALSVDYGTKLVSGLGGVPGLVLLSILGIVTLAAWTNVKRWGWFAFLGSWFFMLLAPSSSFVPIAAEVVAERRIYLALTAVLVLAVVGAEWLRRRFFSRAIAFRQLAYAFGGVAALLTVTTAVRSHTYSSTALLWRDAAAKVPANPRAFDNLGLALFHQRPPNVVGADSAFHSAMALDSTCHFGCVSLASVMTATGQFDGAKQLLERALHFDPTNAPAERSLAFVLMKMGSFESAIPHLESVASRYPTEEHLVVLGVVELSLRRQRYAMAAFQAAERLYPQNRQIQQLDRTLFSERNDEDAIPHLKELALELAQDFQ